MTTISICTRISEGISRQEGGGETRTHLTVRAGPRNLLRLAQQLPEHRARMARAYGNLGSGRSWVQIAHQRINEDDLPETLSQARYLMERVISGAYAEEMLGIQRFYEAEQAGLYGRPLRKGASYYERLAYDGGRRQAAYFYAADAESGAQDQAGRSTAYRLSFKTVNTPDFGGWIFYVECGRDFDVHDYAEAYQLNPKHIDAEDILSAQEAAANLKEGEWLYVTHEAKD